METNVTICSSTMMTTRVPQSGEETEIRRGPWTVEEDILLINYIENNGEGRWNFLARSSGLKRTGKSCRLRWLNYLRPDVRRGNITPEEQLLILELHSRWGNRWSKIAQLLPGRTDNEIKNYWRTRVQKHAKQLRCDVNSKKFKDVMRYLWMPRLVERIQAAGSSSDKCVPLPVGQGEPCPEETSWFSSPLMSNSSTNAYSFQDCEISSTDGIQPCNFDGWSDVAMSPQGYFNHGSMDEGVWEDEMGGNLWNLGNGW